MKFLLMLIAGYPFCMGQVAAQKNKAEQVANEWILKFGPLSFFGTDGGPELAVEYVLTQKRIGLQLEVQPIFTNPWRDGDNDGFAPNNTIKSSYPLGIRLRPEFRYYLYPKPRRRPWLYLSVDAEYKYVDIKRSGNLPVYNGGNTPAYFEQASYLDTKKAYGFHFKSGMLIPFGDSRALMEITYGVGGKYRDFEFKQLPVGASDPERPTNLLGVTQADGWVFSMPLSVKFGIRL